MKTSQSLPTTATRPRATRGALVFIYITFFLDMMGATLLMPITPYIVRQYSTNAVAVGLLTAIYSLAAFAAAPVLGRLSDRLGRRPVLLVSVFGSAIGYWIFGLGGALWVLFLSRLIDGLTGGNIATAMAYIADVTQPEERTKYYAFTGVAFSLGLIFGPVIAGAFSPINLAAPAFVAAGMSLASALFGFFFLPESLPPEKRDLGPLHLAQMNPLSVIFNIARLPNLGLLLGAIFIFYLAFSGIIAYLSVFTFDRFQASASDNAVLFVIVGIVQVVVQGGFVYRLAPQLGEKKLAVTGLALQAAGFPLVAFVPGFLWLYPITVMTTIGSAFSRPTLDALVANSVAPHQRGQASGASAALLNLTNVFGPLLAGLAYTQVSPALPYLAGGALMAAACLLIARLKR